jgi:hypothetical protein
MPPLNLHNEWLSLMDISGPFLAVPVLEKAFPQGLDTLDPSKKKTLRLAYDEWREAIDLEDRQLSLIHKAWIELVLKKVLEFDEDGEEDVFKSANNLKQIPSHELPEYGITLKPDYVLIDDHQDNKPLLFVMTYEHEVDLETAIKDDGWATSPVERMIQLCRAKKTRLGLLSNGERWTLVDATEEGVTTCASWYSRLWGQEPLTLQAFVSLLNIRRFFVDSSEQLPALFDKSLKFQDEVTESLGEQVHRAVEVLIQALDKADVERKRELLEGIEPNEIYESALTIMMRLVFLLCAEERDLLLMGDELYESNYAVSTLRSSLQKDAHLHSEEILDHRYDAWSRLLSIFRAVYGGIEHENLRMPALGGSLFDPDRFPFLEGRKNGTTWLEDESHPLPIDNRTVLFLLEAIQIYEGRTLSYRALDVEQIGYVYEGLLERTASRAKEVTLGLSGTKDAKKPWVDLNELAEAERKSEDALVELFEERTGSSISRVRNDLNKPIEESESEKLLTVCQGNQELRDRIKPYLHLLKKDRWGYPLVYPKDAFMVSFGADRRETGTHYTPKSLTESIVTTTLEPIVYVGPAEGKPREEWQLKSPGELLELKICDPAMGSGAFLVQVCRYLSERLVESWRHQEELGKSIDIEGTVKNGLNDSEPMSVSIDERVTIARCLIAERCLYGVDMNPLAVELAKLSIWLITLTKDRPFGFLDHNLRSGDSLLGLHSLEQFKKFSIYPDKTKAVSIFASNIEAIVQNALDIRKELREIPIRDILDVQYMRLLDQEVRQKLEHIEHIADAMIGAALASGGNQRALDTAMENLSILAASYIDGDDDIGRKIVIEAQKSLSIDSPVGKLSSKPFHWALEFPEVFERGGFDGIVGNPPFMGGRRMRNQLGNGFLIWLKTLWSHSSLNSDFCAFFFLRAFDLLKNQSCFGLIATNTIAQGDTAKTGLAHIIDRKNGAIRYAVSSFKWPGSANVVASIVSIFKGNWNGRLLLNNNEVQYISPILDDEFGWGEAYILPKNKEINFQGSVLAGTGFVLDEQDVAQFKKERKENEQVIYPYLGGDDVNNNFDHKASRWAIDFRDRDLESCSQKWPTLIERVRELVKPQRDMARREAHKKYWWHHGDKRPALYSRVRVKSTTFVISRHTKYVVFVLVSTKHIFQESLCIIDLPSWSSFCLLQSSLHDAWVRRGSSTIRNDLRYTPSDYLDTYPFLHIKGDDLDLIGEKYHSVRESLLEKRREGITALYNHFHDPLETSEDIMEFRMITTQTQQK